MRKRGKDSKKGSEPRGLLFQDGEVRITEGDVQKAVEDARERVGPELAELLTAQTMTDEEMDELGGSPEEQ